MTTGAAPFDISEIPELVGLAEEVARTRTPRLLQHDGRDVALLTPARAPRRRKQKPIGEADIEAALAASWVGLVDPERLERVLDEARGDDRPPVEL